jgi:hypothetical protein
MPRATDQSRREVKRHLVTAALWLLLCHESEARQPEIHHIGRPDHWSYTGEVEVRPSSIEARPWGATSGPYCDVSYCAHGFGQLATDPVMEYEGTFVHGRMDGFGTYVDDVVKYVGGFKQGQFYGAKLTCLDDGRLFEGTFAGDKLADKHWKTLCAGARP